MDKCGQCYTVHLEGSPERAWGPGETTRAASTGLGADGWWDLGVQRAQDECPWHRGQEEQRRGGKNIQGVFVKWQIHLSESMLLILNSLRRAFTPSFSFRERLRPAERQDAAAAYAKVLVWTGNREAHRSRGCCREPPLGCLGVDEGHLLSLPSGALQDPGREPSTIFSRLCAFVKFSKVRSFTVIG